MHTQQVAIPAWGWGQRTLMHSSLDLARPLPCSTMLLAELVKIDSDFHIGQKVQVRQGQIRSAYLMRIRACHAPTSFNYAVFNCFKAHKGWRDESDGSQSGSCAGPLFLEIFLLEKPRETVRHLEVSIELVLVCEGSHWRRAISLHKLWIGSQLMSPPVVFLHGRL